MKLGQLKDLSREDQDASHFLRAIVRKGKGTDLTEVRDYLGRAFSISKEKALALFPVPPGL